MTFTTILGVVGPELESDAGVVLVIVLFAIIIAILPIILFFKVWRMCNDVRDIKGMLQERLYDLDD